jgi:type VI secretion system protein ImpA
LQQIEPHSPIPYLVKRAVRLGSLPFPLLIQQMVRDANMLGELNREFGIDAGQNAS